jgi:hypothetical protein
MGNASDAGTYLAACAYLEEVSVHAFARLAIELESFNAPRDLVLAARRARDDELRHARSTTDLARQFGAEPRRATRPEFTRRSLFEVALENAVEGCIRESYGAAVALVRSAKATAQPVRAALAVIGRDECEHAELSWRIAAWAAPLLTADERAQISAKMRDATESLAQMDEDLTEEARVVCGVPSAADNRRLVALLNEHLYSRAA